MSDGTVAHEITPAETYQLDSDDYDSEEERDGLGDDEYERLAEEAENGFTDEDMLDMTSELKEKGLIVFLRNYLVPEHEGGEVGSLRKLLLGFGIVPPAELRHSSTPNLNLLPFAKVALSRILRRRDKLPELNTIPQAIELLRNAKKIIVLSGAGISTSCGIPDFRSSTGLYAQLQEEGLYALDDPQQMFDIHYFKEHPEVFYSFAKQIYPSNFVPSPCHRWIKLLEDRGVAPSRRLPVLQVHLIFTQSACLMNLQRCKTRVPGPTIEPYIMSSQIPYCGTCRSARDAEIELAQKAKGKGKGKAKATQWGSDSEEEDETGWGGGEPGIMKPDITFFGQALSSDFDECLYKDREEVDLLIIMGTSLKVAPVSEVLSHIPHSVPQIFINLTPVTHVQPDISLLGDADSIVTYLSKELGWEIPPPAAGPAGATNGVIKPSADEMSWISGVGDMSHIHRLITPSSLLDSGEMIGVGGNGGATDGEDTDGGDTDGVDDSASESEDEDRPSKRARTTVRDQV
ncbi:hypothetical protein P7C73_g1254, partial [Tremellales sp. Uapishka_1]